ncbi:zinc protease [Granulicella pectinivorans]|uniref:Zinc protease n=1 Tax=Granulicella pectinivorans TaxID=474950 RepID=A0A1I6MRY5_9BACT|nr:pitrilysin family protein [Granulicella pectinivorans]SFS18513.1 zinc protease [Granulicella pectinivorans]
MKNQILFTTLFALAAVAGAQVPAPRPVPATAAVQPWKKIPIPPLHDFKPEQPKKIVLDNGLTIFLQEDHELPFIDGTILIKGGSRDEPADKVGLVSLYGQTWRTSGTAAVAGDVLDERLAMKAATIETGGGLATTSLRWSSLKEDYDTVSASAFDLLLHPAFKADKLALAKRQLEAGIARRNDDAAGIASRAAVQLAYGKQGPYGRQAEFATVEAVTVADLSAWHDRTLAAGGMIVALEGDFDSAAMEAKLRSVFSTLPRGEALPAVPNLFPPPHPGVYFVDKSDVDQSNVILVGLGTERSNPDYYALSVMNEIFSGGFGSRVFQTVRTKLGLAYSVGGSYGASYDHDGLFEVQAATKSASTVAATRAMIDEIGKLKSVPPTATELKNAKDDVLNSFIFHYDSKDKTLAEQLTLALYGYPADFLEKYKTGIEKVTAEDVTRVANKYIDASKLAIVIVGNAQEMGGPPSALGPVTNLDITIPPPPAPPAKKK